MSTILSHPCLVIPVPAIEGKIEVTHLKKHFSRDEVIKLLAALGALQSNSKSRFQRGSTETVSVSITENHFTKQIR